MQLGDFRLPIFVRKNEELKKEGFVLEGGRLFNILIFFLNFLNLFLIYIYSFIRGQSWSLVVTRDHSWSLVVTRCHSYVVLVKILDFRSKSRKVNKFVPDLSFKMQFNGL